MSLSAPEKALPIQDTIRFNIDQIKTKYWDDGAYFTIPIILASIPWFRRKYITCQVGVDGARDGLASGSNRFAPTRHVHASKWCS